MKNLAITFLSLALLTLAPSISSAMSHKGGELTPKSVIHVVTVSWKDDATPAQIQAALDSVVTLAKEYKGITRVWTRSIKAQGDRSHAFVMEFASEQALKDYADSPAQKKWYETYIPVRKASTTFDITN